MLSRRHFLCALSATASLRRSLAATESRFKLRYVLSSALYGEMPLESILPEVAKSGCESLDVWCRVHGNQREQIREMGDSAFASLLARHQVKLAVSTCYPLGPFRVQDEMTWLNQHGGKIVVTGFPGKRDLTGAELKSVIRSVFETLKPHAEKAAELGITIAIENHQSSTLHHPDSLRYFGELNPYRSVGVALAFHHLHQWTEQIPALIHELGASQIPFIYFQEYSEGARTKVPKEIELQQLPGFGGGLDYRPIVQALREIQFAGLVSLFMHPTPRGIPILPTVDEVTSAVKRARTYIDTCLEATV